MKVNGKPIKPKTFQDRPDTILLPGVRDGDILTIGDISSTSPLPCGIAKEKKAWSKASPHPAFL